MIEKKLREINRNLGFLEVGMEGHPSKKYNLEYLVKPNAIAVMVLSEDEKETLLVEQYRPGARDSILEIPAGLIDQGETPLEALKRELREETGYDFNDFDLIYDNEEAFYVSPGYSTEKIYLYIVRLRDNRIKAKDLKLDEGEDLITKWVPLDKMMELSLDMKTILAYQLYVNK